MNAKAAGRPESIDLDAVVDHEVGGDERVDLRRVAAEVGHRVAHDREVDDGRDAGEVLEDHPSGHERDFGLRGDARPPARQGLDVRRIDDAAARVAEHVLEQDPDRHGQGRGRRAPAERLQAVIVREPGAEGRPGAEGIDP